MTKPLDPRLVRHARATMRFLALSVALGTTSAVLVIAQATVIAHLVVRAMAGESVGTLRSWFVMLAFIAVARAVVMWTSSVVAARSAATAKSELRAAVLHTLADRGPSVLAGKRPGALAMTVSHGIDALDGFFSKYLSQLVLAAVVPAIVMVRIATADWLSALIIAVTIPLVPIFMILVGLLTKGKMNQQFTALTMLSAHFLDILRGLSTLQLLGRAEAQSRGIADVSEQLRIVTMRNLRIAFLSSFVLELCSTMGIALVAVSTGFRLLDGNIEFEAALLVLLLVPEVYVPLRNVGAQFHANADGVAAADKLFTVLDAPTSRSTTGVRAPVVPICFQDVTVTYGEVVALSPLSFTVHAGERVALVGPSGSGKSTALKALLGLVPVSGGQLTIGDVPIEQLDMEWWRSQVSWVPQSPRLFEGSIADNVRLASANATDEEIRMALRRAHLETFTDRLHQQLAEAGSNISVGERRRLGLARAFVRDTPIVLLDEPTADLDPENERLIAGATAELLRGRTSIIVSHRAATLASIAERTVRVGACPIEAMLA